MDIKIYSDDYNELIDNIKDMTLNFNIDMVDEIYKRFKEVPHPFADRQYHIDGNGFEPATVLERLRVERIKSVKEAKASKADSTNDYNLFQLKYFDDEKECFTIPVEEIAKNYFLCYKSNIDNYRRGTESQKDATLLRIYDTILRGFKRMVIDEIDYKSNFPLLNTQERINEQKFAENLLATISDKDNSLSDGKSKENLYRPENFSKQMYIDIVEKMYADKPIVKKAISSYVETLNDDELLKSMNNLLSVVKNDYKRYSFVDNLFNNEENIVK